MEKKEQENLEVHEMGICLISSTENKQDNVISPLACSPKFDSPNMDATFWWFNDSGSYPHSPSPASLQPRISCIFFLINCAR